MEAGSDVALKSLVRAQVEEGGDAPHLVRGVLRPPPSRAHLPADARRGREEADDDAVPDAPRRAAGHAVPPGPARLRRLLRGGLGLVRVRVRVRG